MPKLYKKSQLSPNHGIIRNGKGLLQVLVSTLTVRTIKAIINSAFKFFFQLIYQNQSIVNFSKKISLEINSHIFPKNNIYIVKMNWWT